MGQLQDFTENQASAVTAMQRSYMREEQVQALGIIQDIVNGNILYQNSLRTPASILL